ncbi:argininosuccinate lyase [Abditibacterium utsteinense]|uniref:Argininosuccinate lyase n=1 Tax=Abditibacterium utsteinense TaxID=1960156 RepID=A0A2S8SSP2_9BACT|nr:argininosuccinate lyase [Abditibacterium utsteinense]PQV63834.1 argininosuccinate lyase [Abditibacterium utsteinense]
MNSDSNFQTTSKTASKPLWSGRFTGAPDAAMLRFSTSLPVDSKLWRHDIAGSVAHAQMLGAQKIIAEDDAQKIVQGLRDLSAQIERGQLDFQNAPDEDIHSFIERHLTQQIGPLAGKLHTARSRNDQIALDVRLYLKEALLEVQAEIRALQSALVSRAEEHFGAILPGYTHLQRAQPILLSHHLLAYFWMLERDSERLSECFSRADVLPLGAAALAGTTFPIDREMVAQSLGFAEISINSLDTVADRDHMIESVSALSIIALHLSRLAEEMVLWSTPEWGFVRLSDAFSTGSSIMPQKRNPDSMELVRGKSARVFGDLTTLWTLVKALPLTYNRDLQEDKEPLFDAFDTVISSLQIARGVMESVTFNLQKMKQVAGGGFSTATDVADYLVRKGIPFREAHEITGAVVRECESQGCELENLTLEQWQALDARFDAGVFEAVSVEGSVAARQSAGGTAPVRVKEQLQRAKSLLLL